MGVAVGICSHIGPVRAHAAPPRFFVAGQRRFGLEPQCVQLGLGMVSQGRSA